MISVWKEAINLFEDGQDFCLATIVSLHGSSPRHVGAKFLVKKDGSSIGTIGGGLFEAEVIAAAVEALRLESSILLHFSFTGNDSSSDRMLCGGSAHVFIEFHSKLDNSRRAIYESLIRLSLEGLSGFLVTPVPREAGLMYTDAKVSLLCDETGQVMGELADLMEIVSELKSKKFSGVPELLRIDHLNSNAFVEHFYPEPTVFIFGAGHVGVSVTHLASFAGFRVVLVDDREEFANFDKAPEADRIVVVNSFEKCMSKLTVGCQSYLVIVTRGHSHDKVVLQQALDTPAQYVGMIGSRRKIKLIFESLIKEGVSEDQLERVHAPIGLPIGGETPEEIAVSIVAELIKVKQGASKNLKKSTCMSG